MTAPVLWLGGGLVALLLLVLLRRPLGRLLRLGGRSAVALALLAVLGRLAPFAAVFPGANLVNALVIGLLGLPGLGFLLMVQWMFV